MEITVKCVWIDARIYVEFEKNPELLVYKKEGPHSSIGLKLEEAESLLKHLQKEVSLYRQQEKETQEYFTK